VTRLRLSHRPRQVVAACLALAMATGCASAARGPIELGSTLAGALPESDWSRVRQLEPSAEIVVTVQGAASSTRYFVSADDSRLVVLNLIPTLPAAAARTLREIAARTPDQLVTAEKSGSFERGSVRIGREGVLVDGRRVAAYTDVVEAIVRGRVVRIEGPVVARGSVGGSLIGGWLGFAVGVVPALGGAPEGVAWAVLAGSIAAGAYLGNRWSRHTTDGIVYVAPTSQ
jgi:hypothetical protein